MTPDRFGHAFAPDSWHCTYCGEPKRSIAMLARCVPKEAIELPCDTEPMEADPSPYDLMP